MTWTSLRDRWPALRFAVARTEPKVLVTLVVAALAGAALQGRDVPVPVIPGDAVVRTSPLLPLLVVVVALQALSAPMAVLEATAVSPRLVRARLGYAVAVLCLCSAVAAASAAGADREGASPGMAVASTLTLLGVGLVGAVVLGADLGWLLPCVLALCTFFFGKDYDNQVRGWAWLLHPASDPLSLALSWSLAAAGVAAYAWCDTTGLVHRKVLVS